MRQKFVIENNIIKSELNIKEYANLEREIKNKVKEPDQEIFSLLCEEIYNKDLILTAIGKGKKSLVLAIRTRNMYPILIHAEKIADSVMDLYHTKNSLPFELLFDDKEFLGVAATSRKSR